MDAKEFDKLLEEYHKHFGQSFPLMMVSNADRAVEMIKSSLKKDTIVDDLYPDVFDVGDDIII